MSQMVDKPQAIEGFSIKEVHVEVGASKIRRIAQSAPRVKVLERENVDDQLVPDADGSLVSVQVESHGGDASASGDEGEPSNGDHILTAEPKEFQLAEQLPARTKASTVVVDVVGKERKRARAPSGEMRKADMSPRTIREMIRAKRAKGPSDTALQGEDGTKGRKRARVKSVARGIVKKVRSGRTTVQQNASAGRLNRPTADEVKGDDQTSRSPPDTKVLAATKGTKRRRSSNAEEASIQQIDGDIAAPPTSACKGEDRDDTRAAKRFHKNAALEDGVGKKSRGSKGLSESRV